MTHLSLDLDVLMKEKSVEGQATVHFQRRAKNASTFTLDAIGFDLHEIQLQVEGERLRTLQPARDYDYDLDQIHLHLGTEVESGTITIRYRATPRLGLYFLEPDAQVKNRPQQVWSQCQDEDGRHFFPCQDKPHVKMTYEMRVRVPAGFTALSGGKLLKKQQGKKKTWEYHYHLDVPTPAYLVTLAVGKFDEWQEELSLPSGRKIPLRFYVPVGKKAIGKRAFGLTASMIRVFSERFGVEYPWESYSQVVVSDFIFGGMENTTATTMYEHILLDKRAELDIESHDLVAHELAHQWFGDLVTCRDWSHAWLNEGFATYSELIERRERLGEDEYQEAVAQDLSAYLGEARGSYSRPIVCNDYDQPIDLFDRHLYQKGGLVLHMLRTRLGDELFFLGVKNYLNQHRGKIVETRDLMRALEDASGLSLEAFFDQWVMRPGHPELNVNVSYDKKQLVIEVEQTQKGESVACFELPLEFIVSVAGKEQLIVRNSSERIIQLTLPLDQKPDYVVFDPEFKICAPIQFKAPADMLTRQLTTARSARARAQAAAALKSRQDLPSVRALSDALKNQQELWMVRAAAATSLAKTGAREAFAALRELSQTNHPKVRQAIAEALATDSLAEAALTQLVRDPSYLVSAAACRSLGTLEAPSAERLLKPLLKKASWADVVGAAALDGLCRADVKEAEDLCVELSRYGNGLRIRRQAITQLAKVGKSEKAKKQLRRLLLDNDPHLRASAASALGQLDVSEAAADLEALAEREFNGWVLASCKAALARLQTPKKERANAKLASLQAELRKLKARVQRLDEEEDSRAPTRVQTRSKAALAAEEASALSARASKKTTRKKSPASKAQTRKTPASASKSRKTSPPHREGVKTRGTRGSRGK